VKVVSACVYVCLLCRQDNVDAARPNYFVQIKCTTGAGIADLPDELLWMCLFYVFGDFKSPAAVNICRKWRRELRQCLLQLRRDYRIPDQALRSLLMLTALQTLNLYACRNINDAGLQSLSGLAALQQLNLSCCGNITGEGLHSLPGLTALQQRDLGSCTSITGEGLQPLSGLTELRELNLHSCGITGLQSLSGLRTATASLMQACSRCQG
jgi:hypothetical protein